MSFGFALSFARPELLWLLPIPALLLVWVWQRRGIRICTAADHVERLAPKANWWRWLLALSESLPALALILLILLLAGPRQPAPPTAKRSLTNIELCLDVSGSMTATMPRGQTRYQAAMDAIELFADKRKGDAFGLTIFGDEVLRWLPLTTDLAALGQCRNWLDPHELPRGFGGTQIGKGVRSCIDTLRKHDQGDRMIILLSDGQSADLDHQNAQDIARELAAADIIFYMVYIGSHAPQEEIHAFASATGGAIFTAQDQAGLKRCFADIDTLQPVRVDDTVAGIRPWRRPFLLSLAILGALQLLCTCGLRRTPW